MRNKIIEIVLLVLWLALFVFALLASFHVIPNRTVSPYLYIAISIGILGCVLRLIIACKKGNR